MDTRTALRTRTHTIVGSPIGNLTLVAGDGALVGLYLPEHLRAPSPSTFGDRDDAGFADAVAQLGEYFAGTRQAFDLPLAPVGNDFQKLVWQRLTEIPYGETRTYGRLARELGEPGMARAVGSANARNPLSVIVPCHRVVGSDGSLTGYAGGLARKRFLLDLEAPPQEQGSRLF